MALALGILLTRLTVWPLWIAALIVGIFIIGLLIVAEYVTIATNAASYAVARLAVTALSYLIAFGLFTLSRLEILNNAAETMRSRSLPATQLAVALRGADALVLALPLVDDTDGLIGAEELALLAPGAWVINVARGEHLDTEALLAALDSGHLGGAGLDVTDPEPPQMDNPLLHRDDVIITPHIASATTVGKRRIQSKAISQVVDVLNGRRPDHLVNPEVWPAVVARYAALFA